MKHCAECKYWVSAPRYKDGKSVRSDSGYCYGEPVPVSRRCDSVACRFFEEVKK